jgi:prophage antirepressor-like protein
MGNELVNFNSEEFGEVRSMIIDGEPWFVAKDICEALTISDVSDAVGRLDDDEKDKGKTHTLGGNQEVLVINESGLYSLVLTSRKPEAKKFKRWITSEVLPQIRKTGSYIEAPRIRTHREVLESELALLDRNEKLEQERDEAIRTKAQIGSKREATCMGQVGGLTRKVNTLEAKNIELNNVIITHSMLQLKEEVTATEIARHLHVFYNTGKGTPHAQYINHVARVLGIKGRVVTIPDIGASVTGTVYHRDMELPKIVEYVQDQRFKYDVVYQVAPKIRVIFKFPV